jgi:D-galactarolactone isomerase
MSLTSVPHSTCTGRPNPTLPSKTCDAHLHILDARFAPVVDGTPTPANMTWTDYQQLQQHLGCTRAVIVQAKHYGFDNSCLLDAIAQSKGHARGIAVVAASISDAELERLDNGGVRGLRFSLWNSGNAVASWEDLAPLAARIADLGWHIQLHVAADQLLAQEQLISSLPTPVVIDHMGRLPPQQALNHPAKQLIRRWLDSGRAWVKLSGAYLNSDSGAPDYAPTLTTARQMVEWAPTRMLWGSDWPHITEQHKPDDAHLANLLNEWAGEHAQKILVDNPAELYGFTD